MEDLFVDHLGHALGDTSASVEESAARGLVRSEAAVLREAGFDRHYYCSPGQSAYDLARDAVRTIEDGLGDIGAVVYATCLPCHGSLGGEAEFEKTRDVKSLMDFPASHLQADFGLVRAQVVGLNQQACAGLLGSMRLARAMILAEPDVERVLCVTADRFPGGALYEQAYNLMSDGATCCVVSRRPAGFRLVAFHSLVNGALARVTDDEAVGTFFGYSHRVIMECVARAGLSIHDLSSVVPQNMNRRAWGILSRLLGYEPERVLFPTLAEIGHLVCGDNLVNLRRLAEEGRVRSGDKVLLFMAGYGLNWQAAILERV